MIIPEMSGPSGIYCIAITCESVIRFYVGSSRTLRTRLRSHRAKLTRGAHENPIMQNCWDKYGESVFEITVLEYCAQPLLVEREKHHVKTMKTLRGDIGLNLRMPGEHGYPASHRKGVQMTQEQKDKISRTLTGRKANPESVAKGVAKRTGGTTKLKGKKQTEEHRMKSSIAKKGKPKPTGFGQRVSQALTGRTRSPEHCLALSLANKGRPSPLKGKPSPLRGAVRSEETRKKMSEGRKGKSSSLKGMPGRPHSEEAKRKMSLAKKGKPSPLKGRPSPLRGRKLKPRSEETRRKISETKQRNWEWRLSEAA
jgi:group I intron endonuclease